jgi:hypothetical protein
MPVVPRIPVTPATVEQDQWRYRPGNQQGRLAAVVAVPRIDIAVRVIPGRRRIAISWRVSRRRGVAGLAITGPGVSGRGVSGRGVSGLSITRRGITSRLVVTTAEGQQKRRENKTTRHYRLSCSVARSSADRPPIVRRQLTPSGLHAGHGSAPRPGCIPRSSRPGRRPPQTPSTSPAPPCFPSLRSATWKSAV